MAHDNNVCDRCDTCQKCDTHDMCHIVTQCDTLELKSLQNAKKCKYAKWGALRHHVTLLLRTH
jgi:hypothetical protein